MKTIISLIFTILGISLLCIYSIRDKNEDSNEYKSVYNRNSASEEYFTSGNIYQPEKYKNLDYGISFIILGISMAGIFQISKIRNFTLKTKKSNIALGVFAGLISVVCFVGDFFQSFERGETDLTGSPLIAIMGMPNLFILSIVWVIINVKMINWHYLPDKLNTERLNKPLEKSNNVLIWYKVEIVITFIIFTLSIIEGSYWYVLAMAPWMFFYLSLLLTCTQDIFYIQPTKKSVLTRLITAITD